MTRTLRFPRGLYGITPEWDDTNRLLHAIEQAAAGGLVALQWRRKKIPHHQRLTQAQAVVDHCRALGVISIINDDWQLALQTGADGAHLGRDDGQLALARKALGPDRYLGASCYNELERARSALSHGVDYIAFGAVYPSLIKPDAVAADLALFTQATALVQSMRQGQARAAIVAIGGISPDNLAPVIAAGADSAALISSLFNAQDIRAVAKQCQQIFIGQLNEQS